MRRNSPLRPGARRSCWVARASRNPSAAALEPPQQDIDDLATLAKLLHQRLADAETTIEQLQTALATSRHIGIAVGIIMTRHTVSEQEAFLMLVRASQNSHRTLTISPRTLSTPVNSRIRPVDRRLSLCRVRGQRPEYESWV